MRLQLVATAAHGRARAAPQLAVEVAQTSVDAHAGAANNFFELSAHAHGTFLSQRRYARAACGDGPVDLASAMPLAVRRVRAPRVGDRRRWLAGVVSEGACALVHCTDEHGAALSVVAFAHEGVPWILDSTLSPSMSARELLVRRAARMTRAGVRGLPASWNPVGFACVAELVESGACRRLAEYTPSEMRCVAAFVARSRPSPLYSE